VLESWFPNGMQHYALGGIMLGLAVSGAFASSGLITGMSTVYSSTWSYVSRLRFFQAEGLVASRRWRLVLACGLAIGGFLHWSVSGYPSVHAAIPWWQLGLGGFVAGFGARMSNGCTSGHGICGLASLQLPSLLAVITFLATAMATANLAALLGGTQ
jgi:uncharacterized membrane protein YedE/YeeE